MSMLYDLLVLPIATLLNKSNIIFEGLLFEGYLYLILFLINRSNVEIKAPFKHYNNHLCAIKCTAMLNMLGSTRGDLQGNGYYNYLVHTVFLFSLVIAYV